MDLYQFSACMFGTFFIGYGPTPNLESTPRLDLPGSDDGGGCEAVLWLKILRFINLWSWMSCQAILQSIMHELWYTGAKRLRKNISRVQI